MTHAGPTYSADVVEAAQAQVLQEQDVALQQVMASNRSVVLAFAPGSSGSTNMLSIIRGSSACISFSQCGHTLAQPAMPSFAVGRGFLSQMLRHLKLLKIQLS